MSSRIVRSKMQQLIFGPLFSQYHIDPIKAYKNEENVGEPNNYNSILDNTWLDAPDKCADGVDQNCDTNPADNFVIQHGSYNSSHEIVFTILRMMVSLSQDTVQQKTLFEVIFFGTLIGVG